MNADTLLNYLNQSITVPVINIDIQLSYIVLIALAFLCIKNIAGAVGRTLFGLIIMYVVLKFVGISPEEAINFITNLAQQILTIVQQNSAS